MLSKLNKFFKNLNLFPCVELDILLSIPALNEGKIKEKNSAEQGLIFWFYPFGFTLLVLPFWFYPSGYDNVKY